MTDRRARRVGVIDVGSNSVRLVIYDVHGAAHSPCFNEKVMAGLGRGLGETGKLSPEGWQLAIAALRRFRALLDALDVRDVRAVATAAVRVATDGPAFAREAAVAAKVPLSILSGVDEGRISALGVASGMFQAEGLVADLGGSSLELYPIGERDFGAGETLMLGPLALAQYNASGAALVRATIREALSTSTIAKVGLERLYAVGGAWRALAKVAMEDSKYPLRILQGFTLEARDISRLAKDVEEERVENLSSIAGRRAAQLHLTAAVLDELVQLSGASEIVVSSYGLREGLVSEMMSGATPDGLVDGIIAAGRLDVAQSDFGEVLFDFSRDAFKGVEPVMGGWTRESRLHRAACLLADSGGRYHPDHRAAMAAEQALYAGVPGLTHPERIFIASAVGARYARSFSLPRAKRDLLQAPQFKRARQLGQVMRLGAAFSGRSGPLLKGASLAPLGERLVLSFSHERAELISETVERRLYQTADLFDLKPQVSLI
ncbi:MAG: Ppx/GppA family phosphatase [Pseudomonadota bacterium]